MRIETDRLIIDDLKKEDKENYFLNISHDKNVLETFMCLYQDDLESFYFDKYLNRPEILAIRLKDTKELIGIFVESDIDENNHSLEIGYGIGTKYWGKGYMTEVVKEMINYFFTKTSFKTIYASFFPNNIKSKRVMEKCKMTYSHTNLKELTYLGKERDLIYYKIEKVD